MSHQRHGRPFSQNTAEVGSVHGDTLRSQTPFISVFLKHLTKVTKRSRQVVQPRVTKQMAGCPMHTRWNSDPYTYTHKHTHTEPKGNAIYIKAKYMQM